MKILFAIQGFHKGGVSSAFLVVARLLEAVGHEVRVVLSSYNGRDPVDCVAIPNSYVLGWIPEIHARSTFLSRLWIRLNARLRWRPYFWLNAFRFPKYNYDCFVLFHGQDMIWRWWRNRPSVMFIHDAWGGKPGARRIVDDASRDLIERSKCEAGAGFDRYVAVSRQSASAFRKVYHPLRSPTVINNLIDIPRVKRLSVESQTDITYGKDPNILFVGRLSWEKGVDRLLEAAARLHAEGAKFRLWLVGEGDDGFALRRLAEALGIFGVVRFLGVRDNPYPLMKASDLLVLPSRAEGMGLVLWESLLCGTPVLATDCGGTRDALRDGEWGILVENSTKGIENGLRGFLKTRQAPAPAIVRRAIEEADARNREALERLFSNLERERAGQE